MQLSVFRNSLESVIISAKSGSGRSVTMSRHVLEFGMVSPTISRHPEILKIQGTMRGKEIELDM